MKALIVIPTYNERDNIGKLIGRLLNLPSKIDILVVDDSSPDGTADVVNCFVKESNRVNLLVRPTKGGIGPAYLAGFKWGLSHDFDVFFEMDADLSHRPRYIQKFLQLICTHDLVIGSRWIRDGRIAKWQLRRVLLSRLANLYSSWVLGVQIYDLTGGFVCYRRAVLEALDLDGIHSDGYSFQIEMKYRTIQSGFRLHEFPITFTDRKAGDSKISRRIVIEALLMVWKLKLGKKPQRQQEAVTMSNRMQGNALRK
jgi:dolichol-phosphate mannosyltransferase